MPLNKDGEGSRLPTTIKQSQTFRHHLASPSVVEEALYTIRRTQGCQCASDALSNALEVAQR